MSEGARILIVDDEPAIRKFLRTVLTAHGYDVAEAQDGAQAVSSVASFRPDVIVLDLGLPDMDGVQVTSVVRTWSQTPILILSVRGGEADKIAALDAGADDYLTKPFGSGELLARLRVALRRAAKNANEPLFQTGALKVEFAKRIVTLNENEIQLTPTEYDLLKTLALQADKVLTHQQLLRAVWGVGYEMELHMLRVNISNVRRKIEPDPTRPQYLITEPGVGYRLRRV
ncbi:MAG: KDP operon transcriptional regulatory protein KdpE [Anaerolineae bacterium]|nr:KDP operon transcriptional regulatory protein KdpE [Anaerolineae bacterium]RIK28623.1 MAG: DNA-binding response regulator [Chloroflexota bacterium]